jgi:hypothetical protein
MAMEIPEVTALLVQQALGPLERARLVRKDASRGGNGSKSSRIAKFPKS